MSLIKKEKNKEQSRLTIRYVSGTEEPQLAMAFANRSAAQFHLAAYVRALVDIDQALANGYPDDLRYKLAERQAKCLVALGRSSDQIVAACELAIKCVNDSRLDVVKRQQFEQEIELLISESAITNKIIPDAQIQPKRGKQLSLINRCWLHFNLGSSNWFGCWKILSQ